MLNVLRISMIAVVPVAATHAQSPAFEVASVRASAIQMEMAHSSQNMGRIEHSATVLTMRNTSLKSAIQWAYKLNSYQVFVEDRLGIQRYDIVGKAEAPVSEDELRLMLRSLLVQRFKLSAHPETRDMSVHILEVGKRGSRFKESLEPGEGWVRPGPEGLEGVHASLAQLAEVLNFAVSGPVVDRTKLNGRYDFSLQLAASRDSRPEDVVTDALARQLGLSLKLEKTSITVLVVDHVEALIGEN